VNAAAAPPKLVESLPHAREILLTVANAELGDALDLLARHVVAPYRVQVIWNHSDLDLLDALLRRGYHVYDGAVEAPNRLFAGRSLGYRLPCYEPIPDASARSHQDWWRRVGTFLLLSGVVGNSFPERELFQLVGREHFFIRIPSGNLPPPKPGTEVDVLVNCPWASSRTLLASAERIRVRGPAGSTL
jgi:hypothetical protein